MAGRASLTRHGVTAIERTTISMGPLTMVVPEAEFDKWLAASSVGDTVIYAHGPALPQGNAVCTKARDLYDAGQLQLSQKKAERGKHYLAKRVKPAPAIDPVETEADILALEREVAGTPAGRVLDILKRCANFDRQVPSLAQLANQADLPNRQRANYLKTVLEEKGLISIHRQQGCVQVITIASSGKRTKGGV